MAFWFLILRSCFYNPNFREKSYVWIIRRIFLPNFQLKYKYSIIDFICCIVSPVAFIYCYWINQSWISKMRNISSNFTRIRTKCQNVICEVWAHLACYASVFVFVFVFVIFQPIHVEPARCIHSNQNNRNELNQWNDEETHERKS